MTMLKAAQHTIFSLITYLCVASSVLGQGADAIEAEIDSYLTNLDQSFNSLLLTANSRNYWPPGEMDYRFSREKCGSDLGRVAFEELLLSTKNSLNVELTNCRFYKNGDSVYSDAANWNPGDHGIAFIHIAARENLREIRYGLLPSAIQSFMSIMIDLNLQPSPEAYLGEVNNVGLNLGYLPENNKQPCVIVELIGPSGDAMIEFNFMGSNSENLCLEVFPGQRYEETRQATIFGELERDALLLVASRMSNGIALDGVSEIIRNNDLIVRDQVSNIDDESEEFARDRSFISQLLNGFGIFSSNPTGPSQAEIVSALYEVPEARALFKITLEDANTYCENSRDCIVEAQYVIDLLPRTKDAFISSYLRVLSALGVAQFELRMLEASLQTALMFGDYPNNVRNIIPQLGSPQRDIMRFVKGQEGWMYLAEENQNTSSPSQPYNNPLQGWVREHAADSFR